MFCVNCGFVGLAFPLVFVFIARSSIVCVMHVYCTNNDIAIDTFARMCNTERPI